MQARNVQKNLSMNDFIIQKVIGEGAYGRAILCKTKSDNQLVVVKEIALSNMSKKEQLEAWKETRVLGLLDHPNIISYRGCFMEKNCLHIVMDYADGGDLFEEIQKAKTTHFKEEQILEWFVQICLALKHVHDRKILHRDIKCQNIFLTKKGVVKMGDFGIAKILDHTTQLSKTAIGTPYYLSPEICQGKAYNMKSDIWSLGCVLYELCSLQHAFDSKCMNGLIMAILRSKQNPIPYTYSQNLRSLVDKLLQKDPRKRPSINQILRLDFIQSRIEHFLSETQKKFEFCHTVFHGVKGGETPKDIMAEPSSEPHDKPQAAPQKVPSSNAIQAPKPSYQKPPSANQIQKPVYQAPPPPEKPNIAPPGRPPAQNEIPKLEKRPPPKIQHGLPVNKNPQRNPQAAAQGIAPPSRVQAQQQAAVKPLKPKPPREPEKKLSKDEILARKNADVIAERQRQKELREKREREDREAEERAEKKRQELMAKKAQREAERKAQMANLKKEAAERQKHYNNLEAPFKKAMGGGAAAPPPAAHPAKPSHPSKPTAPSGAPGERAPKYRESYFDDDDLPPDAFPPEGEPVDKPAARPKPKLPDKQPTVRPDKVKNREEEQKNLRELILKRRAELKQQKLAEARAAKEFEAKIAQAKAEQQQQEPPAKPAPAQPKPEPAPAQPKPAPAPAQPKPAPAPATVPKKEEPKPVQPAPPKKEPKSVQPPPQPVSQPEQPKSVPQPQHSQERAKLEDLIDMSSSDESDENDMISLAAVMQNILNHPPSSDDEDGDDDNPKMKTMDEIEEEQSDEEDETKSHDVFMFNNKELKLPMVTDHDSLHYRVEALRQFIEENLGIDKFIEVYQFITVDGDQMTNDEGYAKITKILSKPEELSFYTLIQQLVFCEESL